MLSHYSNYRSCIRIPIVSALDPTRVPFAVLMGSVSMRMNVNAVMDGDHTIVDFQFVANSFRMKHKFVLEGEYAHSQTLVNAQVVNTLEKNVNIPYVMEFNQTSGVSVLKEVIVWLQIIVHVMMDLLDPLVNSLFVME